MKGGNEYKKRLWSMEEDRILMDYIRVHGKGKWNRVAKLTSLKRCGKSCRLRWMNYLSPSVKRGDFSQEEEDLIIRLHNLLGNRWSLIAGRVPGRTDNQVKNHWNSRLRKKLGFMKKSNDHTILSIPNSQEPNTKDSEKNIINNVRSKATSGGHDKTMNTEDGSCHGDFYELDNHLGFKDEMIGNVNSVYELTNSSGFSSEDACNNTTTSDHRHNYSMWGTLLDFPLDFDWDCL